VQPDFAIKSTMRSAFKGLGGKNTEAPATMGNNNKPPKPKVKAKGGVPITMSSV
jgi:hypothetical protein